MMLMSDINSCLNFTRGGRGSFSMSLYRLLRITVQVHHFVQINGDIFTGRVVNSPVFAPPCTQMNMHVNEAVEMRACTRVHVNYRLNV